MQMTQMLKGILEGCILKILEEKPNYGYGILQILNKEGFHDLSESTLYPILLRLQKSGQLDFYHESSKLGPKRKYYKITPNGKESLQSFTQDYTHLNQVVSQIFKRSEP